MPLQKRINPVTGQVEYREAPMQQGPGPDPRIPLQVQGQTLGNQKTAQEIELDRRKFILERQKFIADLAAKGLQLGPDGTPAPIPGWKPQPTAAPQIGGRPELSAAQFSDALAQFGGAEHLAASAKELRRLGQAGPDSTKGLAGLRDYLPNFLIPENQAYDKEAGRLRAWAKQGTGTTGGENNSLAEMKLNLGSYIPSTMDSDGTNANTYDSIDNLAEKAQIEAIRRLGGIPDANGRITPLAPGQMPPPLETGKRKKEDEQPPLVGMAGGGNPPPNGPDWFDPNSTDPTKPSAGFLMAPQQRQERDMDALKIANQIYAQTGSMDAVNQAMRARGLPGYAGEPSAEVRAYNKRNPGYGYFQPPVKTVDNSAWERISGGGPAATVAGYANGATFGAVEALAGGMGGMREAHPGFSAVGEIAGTIKNGGIMGRAGTAAATKYAPRLLGGGKGATVARQVASDATYGAVRGGLVDGDPLSGAGLGAAGSLVGQGAGSVIGRALSGITSSPRLSRLREMGVNPTMGQMARARAMDNGGGSRIAGIEDSFANLPGIGAGVVARRGDALEQANTGVFNRSSGGSPITGVGTDALGQLRGAKNAAYSDALDGVRLQTNDPRFINQIDAAGAIGAAADKARGKNDFSYVMDTELRPLVAGSNILSGKQLQDALRVLESNKRAFTKAANGPNPDPAAMGVAKAFQKVEDAFTGLTARQAPGAIPKLKKANKINRNLSILDDAAERASSDGGVFTGAQLGASIKKNNGMFGARGLSSMERSPLYQAQQDMVDVLPNKVPQTGVNNALPLAIPLVSAGVAGGGEWTENDLLRNAGVLGLMASGAYSKAGAKAVAKALLDRPESLRRLGTAVRKKKGMIGTGAAPLLIEYAN